ncbi:hypothetical protein E4U47_003665 [Claviceps purpurea]|nr:hypothetical protein E4U47_003665 [Claviceps purpurea]
MPSPSLSAHRLASETSLHIFQSQILPAEFPHLPSPSHHGPFRGRPLAVLTVGQTGAGKTRMSRAILAAMHVVRRDANAPAHLIADTYKIYHPDYAHLILSAPHLASAATGPDARRWLAMAAEEVVRRAMDVLVESACRHPADFEDLVRIFSEANYRLEVVLLAVPAPLSRLGILVRYYEKLPEAQSGKLPVRLTPQTVHDESYGGLVGAASFLDRSGLADQVIVVRRGNMVAYGVDRAQMDGARIAEALIKERERPLTRDELKTAVADLSRLSKLRDADEQVDLVRHMLSPLTGDEQRWPELKPLVFGNNRREAEGTYNVLRLGQMEAL